MKKPLAILALAVICATFSGCNSTESANVHPLLADAAAADKKTGTQLWADNCTRCHNARPSTQYSAQQWDLIVHHMRLRANLTGEEQRTITEFLQSGG